MTGSSTLGDFNDQSSDGLSGNSVSGEAESTSTEGVPHHLEDNGWVITTESDPIDDVKRTIARYMVYGDTYDVQVEVTCSDKGLASYAFATFNKAGDSAQMRLDPNPLIKSDAYTAILRVDDQRLELHDVNIRYNNVLKSSYFMDKILPANSFYFRLSFPSGDETYQLDQSSEDFKAAISNCLKSAERSKPSDESE